ncbi:hypothetical protein ACFIOY_16080 [Bradyrhizobium sp. TZ2]
MIHYTRPSGTMPLVEEAKAIARAASDVGIRIAFALAVRDQNPVVYGDSEPLLSGLGNDDRKTIEDLFVRAPRSPPQAYIELTDAIAAAISGPKLDVQHGPAGVQWCSKPLLEAVAENSAQTGRRIHMHLLETIYQRAWADQNFPQGVVRYLRDIGFLSERLTLARALYPRPARRNRDDRSVWSLHRHQLQFQPALALRSRADRRCAPMRLSHRGRRSTGWRWTRTTMCCGRCGWCR